MRGDQKICEKVPPFLYSLFKHKILTYNRAMHMQLIDIDDPGVNHRQGHET